MNLCGKSRKWKIFFVLYNFGSTFEICDLLADAVVSQQMNTLHFDKSHNSSPNLKGVAKGNASTSLTSSSSSNKNTAAAAVAAAVRIVLPQIQAQPIFATSSSSSGSSSGHQTNHLQKHHQVTSQAYENGELLGQADIIEREYQRQQQQHHASKSGRGKYNQSSATTSSTNSNSNQLKSVKRKLETGELGFFFAFKLITAN